MEQIQCICINFHYDINTQLSNSSNPNIEKCSLYDWCEQNRYALDNFNLMDFFFLLTSAEVKKLNLLSLTRFWSELLVL